MSNAPHGFWSMNMHEAGEAFPEAMVAWDQLPQRCDVVRFLTPLADSDRGLVAIDANCPHTAEYQVHHGDACKCLVWIKDAWRPRSDSESWLRYFCASADCPGYDDVMRLIDEGRVTPDNHYAEDGDSRYDEDYVLFMGTDAHGLIPPEFWDHAEVVLVRKLSKRPEWFSCSC